LAAGGFPPAGEVLTALLLLLGSRYARRDVLVLAGHDLNDTTHYITRTPKLPKKHPQNTQKTPGGGERERKKNALPLGSFCILCVCPCQVQRRQPPVAVAVSAQWPAASLSLSLGMRICAPCPQLHLQLPLPRPPRAKSEVPTSGVGAPSPASAPPQPAWAAGAAALQPLQAAAARHLVCSQQEAPPGPQTDKRVRLQSR
jgi:hypothetical protein